MLTTRLAIAVLIAQTSALAAQQAPPRLVVREVLRLGLGMDRNDITFGAIGGIASGPRGEIFVLDSEEQRVSVFDSTGRLQRSMGLAGSGPGEFRWATSLHVDSLVTVFDVMQARQSTFDLQGNHRETRPVKFADLRLAAARASGGGVVGATATAFTRARAPAEEGIIAVVFARGTRVDTLISYRGGASMWHVPGQSAPWGGIPSPTGDLGAWLAFGDTVVVADGISGRLRWFVTAGQLRIVRQANLGLAARRVTDTDRKRFLAELRSREKSAPAKAAIEAPAHWSIATGIVRTDDGTLWIRNGYSGAQGNTYTELSPRGQQKRWSLPNGFVLRAVRGNRLIGSQAADLDVPTVVVYQKMPAARPTGERGSPRRLPAPAYW
jgi:hypothetical protein